MQVDLIEALGDRASGADRVGEVASTGEFPKILESRLDSKRPGDGAPRDEPAGKRDGIGATRAGARSDEAGAPGAGRSASSARPSAADDRPEAAADASRRRDACQEQSEATAASGAPAAAAGALPERARELAALAADQSQDGRLTDLEERGQARASAGEGGDAGGALDEVAEAESLDEVAEAESLDEAVAREVAEAVAPPDEASEQGEEAVGLRASETRAGMSPGAAADPEARSLETEPDGMRALVGEQDRALQAGDERRAAEAAAEREAVDAAREASEASARVAEQAGLDRAELERAAEEARVASGEAAVQGQSETREAALRAPETSAIDGAGAIASPVAGMMTETTPSAAPGMPAPAAAAETIAVQTEWLATRGGGTVRLVLHPPELGEMAIRVTLRGGAVDVVVVAQEHAAADVADKQADRLAQAFAGRDLRLEHFEVRRGDPGGLGAETGGHFAQSGSDGERETGRRDEAAPATRALPGLGGEAGAARAMPRIATIAPKAGGIDLRI